MIRIVESLCLYCRSVSMSLALYFAISGYDLLNFPLRNNVFERPGNKKCPPYT